MSVRQSTQDITFNFQEFENVSSKKKKYISKPTEGDSWDEVLPVDKINVDTEHYQRPISPTALKMLMDSGGFDKFHAKQILVSLRSDGTYWAVDGGHRLALAKECGVEFISCKVKRYASIAGEANDFRHSNDLTLKVTSSQKFNAKILQGDPVAIGIENTVLGLGYTLDCHKKHKGASIDIISCTDLLEEIFNKVKGKGLAFIIKVAAKAFPDSHRRFCRDTLWAIYTLGVTYSEIDWQNFISQMRKTSLIDLYNDASKRKQIDKSSMRKALFIQMRTQYNLKCKVPLGKD